MTISNENQDLIVYAWDVTNRRYLRAHAFKVTVDYEEGVHRQSQIAFWKLPTGKHYVSLVEKPDGYILEKWESGAERRWVEVDIHRPERRETYVTTHSGGPGFLWVHLKKVDIRGLLRERKAVMDKITSSLRLVYDEMSAIELKYLCRERWPECSIIIWDGKYRFVTHEKTLTIIDYDWIDAKSYKSTFFDCDDFALCLKGHLAENWGVNGVCFAEGSLWRDDECVGIHAYNYILVTNEDSVELLLFEPQSDAISENDTLGETTYKPYRIIW